MKTVVVTGCSRGIGLQTVKYLLNKGCEVIAISRNIEPLLDLKSPLLRVYSLDISNELAYNGFQLFLKENIKKIDSVIHNAGFLIKRPFLDLSRADFISCYKTNVFAVADFTRLLVPFMAKPSHFVAISSIGGMQGSLKFGELAAYSSSKGALNILFEVLAESFKEQKIAFNTLALGAVQTKMLKEAFPDFIASVSAKQMGAYIGKFALEGHLLFNGKTIPVANSTP